ncbi:MAG: FtsX-like permease family protein [Bacteroidota bacterium]
MGKLGFEYFFAKRLVFDNQRSVSILVVWLAMVSIALAVATMEIAVSVKRGFESQIQNKVVGFGSHLQIGNYLSLLDTEVNPLPKSESSIRSLDTLDYVKSVAPYVIHIGMYKSDVMEDIWLKGVDSAYDWSFINTCLDTGRLPIVGLDKPSQEVLISRIQSKRLSLNVGDKFRMYFFGKSESSPLKIRPMKVVGIYDSGMEEFDDKWAFCDMLMLQKVWNLDADEVIGFEVNLQSLSLLEGAKEEIDGKIPIQFEAKPITERFPEIFGWLTFIQQNVSIILLLMFIVAITNMTTVILILIIERTYTIGILQSLGLTRFRIRRMFVIQAFFLILFGVLIGNVLGIGLIYSQDIWGWLKLDQENYYLDKVPVSWEWVSFLWINLGVIFACTLCMYLPTWIISRITPVEAIRFE